MKGKITAPSCPVSCASLDTLDILPKTQTVTNTVVQRVEVPGKPKRWQSGVSAGYALTPQGVKP